MNKFVQRFFSAAVALAIPAAAFSAGSGMVMKSSADTSSPAVLFSTSFEDNETDVLKESTVESDRISNVVGTLLSPLTGDVGSRVVKSSIAGTASGNNNEVITNIFDHNTSTKYLVNSSSLYVSFQLDSAQAIRTCAIVSANDAPGRDPKNWTLYGSADGSGWTALNSQSNQDFTERFQQKIYTFTNETAYTYYKLEITANHGDGMTQFSELQLGTGQSNGSENVKYPMNTVKSSGPASSYCAERNVGWTGARALMASGYHTGAERAYAYNVIYDGLNIPVSENTELSYMVFPSLPSGNSGDSYDFYYTSMYVAVDLKFTDGTYLSELSATDQNGTIVSPTEQGNSKALYYWQWNHIYSTIGEVAKGKTIEKIIIGYDKPDNAAGKDMPILAYFDDIKLQDTTPVTYDHRSDYINILRGSNNTGSFSRGLIAPIVNTPHGFNHWVPVNNNGSSQPYVYQHYTMGSMTIDHYASNWIAEYGTWQFMPNSSINPAAVTNGDAINYDARTAGYSHENEIAKAHYYSVTFNQDDIRAAGVQMEVTPTEHAAYTRFTFPSGSAYRNLIFDCNRGPGGIVFDDPDQKSFRAYSDHTSSGSKRMYVYGVFDQPYDSAKAVGGKQGIVNFAAGTDTVTLKIATSFISYDQAKRNLELEISESDTFDTIKDQTQQIWDDQLGIIDIEGATYDQMVTFYSNMYRLFSYPILASENEGTNAAPDWKYTSPYSGSNDYPAVKAGKIYTINGFWDTYRTCWAAYALLTPSKDTELLNGLVQHYLDQGWIPRWMSPGGTNSMVGTSSDVIFGDAIKRGIPFDYENAFKSALKNAAVVSPNLTNGGRKELETSIFKGYTSTAVNSHDTGTGGGFSWSLEGYINDYGISQLAEALGYTDEAAYYRNRAQNYVNLYNPDLSFDGNSGWFVGKNPDGTFANNNPDPNNTSYVYNPNKWYWDYTETNGQVMSFYTPQDVQGLINLYGGKEKAAERLDKLFNADIRTTDYGLTKETDEAREVRMGQYQHSNQPSHHLPYMYNYLGQPWRTQEIVREVLDRCYVGSSIGQGYIGDEDNGEMSAWYILSSLGIYPASMGNPEFTIGSPLFKEATVHLENGKDLVISAPDNSRENIYIQSVKWNGEDYSKNYILHSDLLEGGTLEFTMGSEPSAWGSEESALPTSITKNSAAPSPAADITLPGASVVAAIPVGSVTADTIGYSGSSNVANLVDNTSNTTASFTEKNVIVDYATPKAKKVTMYTITTGSNAAAAPVAVTLYGSGTGKSTDWVKLDERTGLTFEWSKYTRPFAVPEEKQGKYSYYKVVMTSGATPIEIAELELIGSSEEPLSSDVYRVDSQNKLITGVGEETAVAAFKTRFNNSVTVTRNGTEVTTGNVGTGMTVTDSTGTSYTVVIYGDVSGDGKIGAQDIMVIRKFLISDDTSYLNEAQKKAANLSAHKTPNPNDQIDALDIMLLRKHLLGSSSIEQ